MSKKVQNLLHSIRIAIRIIYCKCIDYYRFGDKDKFPSDEKLKRIFSFVPDYYCSKKEVRRSLREEGYRHSKIRHLIHMALVCRIIIEKDNMYKKGGRYSY